MADYPIPETPFVPAVVRAAPCYECKVGDLIRIPFQDRFRVWRVTGIHLGAAVAEDVVTLRVLDLKDGWAYGKRVAELMVPMILLHTHGGLHS